MIPHPPNLSYLPFQEEGIEFCMGRSSALIGDAPGLGKTIEACGYINTRPEIESALIVCPATLCINWRRELDKWLVSPFVDSLVVSYDNLHKLDFSIVRDLVIWDEAHYLKNESTQRSTLSRKIKAKNRLALTGTPILSRPVELRHILYLLNPSAWTKEKWQHFGIRYCNGHYGPRGWDESGASHLDELKEKLKNVMIRRTKEEVLKDLPAKRRQLIELPTIGIDRELKFKLVDAAKRVEEIEDTYAHDARKLECELELVWSTMAELRHEAGKAKAPMIVDAVKDMMEEEEKLVIFAHHRDVIDMLLTDLSPFAPVHIHGGTPERARQQAIDLFQNDPQHRLFIGQIQAAGVGITLTAASHVIFAESDWVPGIMEQAEDRCHRIGQKESVLIQHMCLENSLDAHMCKVLVRKQGIIDRVF